MYNRKIPKDIQCPIEQGLDILSGKWKSSILCVLAQHKVLRYNDIKSEIPSLSDTILSLSLKELVAAGIVDRVQYNTMPLKVEYRLTKHGEDAIPILEAIALWNNKYSEEVLEYNSMPICSECLFKEN